MNNNREKSLIRFEKASREHLKNIFDWLNEPHMQEFWDNSQEHKNDIVNFINGRIVPSNYFNGIFTYWIGLYDSLPYCLMMTAEVTIENESRKLWKNCISETGKTYSLDFGIGNKSLLGCGLASLSLELFTRFFKNEIDHQVDTFLIDPDQNNPRAIHVYEKAGFNMVGEFNTEKKYHAFNCDKAYLMIKKC